MLLEIICRKSTFKFERTSTTTLTMQREPQLDEGHVPCEEKQDFDEGPLSGPDERDFLWECQEVIINLRHESDTVSMSSKTRPSTKNATLETGQI
jgi:hypothetical protein